MQPFENLSGFPLRGSHCPERAGQGMDLFAQRLWALSGSGGRTVGDGGRNHGDHKACRAIQLFAAGASGLYETSDTAPGVERAAIGVVSGICMPAYVVEAFHEFSMSA